MKKFYKSIRIKISLVVIGLLCLPSLALGDPSPIATVNSVTGNVFILDNGNTRTVQAGDNLYDFNEVLTEIGGQITFSDYFDHKYHLAGGGHIKILNKIIELRQGYFWIQSRRKDEDFMAQTANSKVKYQSGEGIVSFDNYSGKTQIVVIKGQFEFGNLLEDHLKLNVAEGQFSFIHAEYENGAPRIPTSIGYSSFNKMTSLFPGISPLGRRQSDMLADLPPTLSVKKPLKKTALKAVGRKISSVTSAKSDKPQGKIIYRNRPNYPTGPTKKMDLDGFYVEKIKKKMLSKKKKRFAPSYARKSPVKLRVFGGTSTPSRKPAQIGTQKTVMKKERVGPHRKPSSIVPPVKIRPGQFEKSLMNEYKKQMRHSTEVNSLINDLKNFDQDYKEYY